MKGNSSSNVGSSNEHGQAHKVLVTGASGFIGSHLIKQLSENGFQVVAYCRRPERIQSLATIDGVQCVQGLLSETDKLRAHLQGCKSVVHLALGWGESASEMLINDTLASVKLAELSIEQGVQRFIYTSSVMALGEYRKNMGVESAAFPLDTYGASKAATESYLWALSRDCDMAIDIVRPVNVFGNRAAENTPLPQDKRIYQYVKSALNGEPIQIIKNDGSQCIWIGDLVDIYCQRLAESEAVGEMIVAGAIEKILWQDIVEILQALGAPEVDCEVLDLNWAIDGSFYDCSTASKYFNNDGKPLARMREHIHYLMQDVSGHLHNKLAGLAAV